VKPPISTGPLWRWVWLALALLICGYRIATSGGLAGALLVWEIEKFGSVDAGLTHVLLLMVLVVPPIWTLAAFYKKRHVAII